MLLALDTATTAVTAAVVSGGRVLAEVSHLDARRHTELLAPAVADVLGRAGVRPGGLDGVVVGVGPGPFTGLRVGVMTATVLGHTAGVPVHGVCSLDALAAAAVGAAGTPASFLVATDARRKEVYWARYAVRDGRAVRVEGPAVARAADLPDEVRLLPAVGRGPQLYPESLVDLGGPRDVAAGVLGLVAEQALGGHGVELLEPLPLYLRRPDAAVPGAAKPVRP